MARVHFCITLYSISELQLISGLNVRFNRQSTNLLKLLGGLAYGPLGNSKLIAFLIIAVKFK